MGRSLIGPRKAGMKPPTTGSTAIHQARSDNGFSAAAIGLARKGRTRDFLRLVIDRLVMLPSVSQAGGTLVDTRRGVGWEHRQGPNGREERTWTLDRHSEGRTESEGDAPLPDVGGGWAAPLLIGGSVTGSLDIAGHAVPQSALDRLHDLASFASVALELAAERNAAIRSVTEVATVLSSLIESRDTYTESHCVALAEMSVGIGIRMGLSENQLTTLNLAGHLHDIGKVSIPDEVLLKQAPLTDAERSVMQTHTSIGERVVSRISLLSEVAPVVGQHHEWFDGSGYPRGLRGEEIVLEARILAVVDAFDAMTTSRPYRPALNTEVAVGEIREGAGSQFDPDVAGIFLTYLEGEEAQWTPTRSH